jgi:hypothetical protein
MLYRVKYLLILLSVYAVSLLFPQYTSGQSQSKKTIQAIRIENPPKIDGVLDEDVWDKAPTTTDFVQFVPYNGKPATFNSDVRFVYDDMAIYVGAMLYDPNPDSILTELSQRDEINMADYFGVYFDCYNDYLTAYGFFVTASGVQVDMKSTGSNGEDEIWDAVWKSEVKIIETGWIAEFKIPYSALRFPKIDEQVWGLQIFRNIMRYRENTTWNFINREIDGINNQAGELHGISKIKPPLRLSFVPYLAGYVEKSPESKTWGYSYNYGLDVKYGINESYTLDMTLIPDFGQVQSDDKIYNLTPFEIYYDEKRPFFMEGTELFDKGDVFYTRRLGSQPSGYNDVSNQLDSNERITENPTESQLINATKITGKSSKGLALGIFNGMTANTYAIAEDTLTNESRKIKTEPFSNYNMFILEQAMKNYSFVNFFNTNVYRPDNHYSANVSSSELRLADKTNKYLIYGLGSVSQKYNKGLEPEFGYKYVLTGGKISGNFTLIGEHDFYSDKYDPNDMGFLLYNNYITDELTLGYNIYEPVWKILEWRNELTFTYEQQFMPRDYSQFEITYSTFTTFKNHLSTWYNASTNPVESKDHYEPRVDGWYLTRPPFFNMNLGFSPDYRHRFVVDVDGGFLYCNGFDQFNYWFGIEPRFRVNDKLMLVYEFSYEDNKNDMGYVTDSTDNTGNEVIIFGKRYIRTFENTFDASYKFTNKSSLAFRLRHYWITLNYKEYYRLLSDGSLTPSGYIANNDFGVNIFNIDLVYTWNFAPGSEINIVWKNSITTSEEATDAGMAIQEIETDYFQNLQNTISSPATNSFSIKVLYYLDYQYLKRKKKEK